MNAVEMQFAALRLARREVEVVFDGPQSVRHIEAAAVLCLPHSTPYAWAADPTRAVWLASRSIPGDTRFDARLLFPENYSAQWWWFDWPLPIPTSWASTEDLGDVDLIHYDVGHISGLLIRREAADEGEGLLAVYDFRASDLGPLSSSFIMLPDGASLNEILAGVAVNPDTRAVGPTSTRVAALSRFLLAAGTWLSQRIVVQTSGPIERHRRKAFAREHEAVVSDVKVIQLRRYEAQTHETESSAVDWSCRWIVNGHWRNQAYADGRHKLIYIMPFVKGPDDKPLRLPAHTIYDVNR